MLKLLIDVRATDQRGRQADRHRWNKEELIAYDNLSMRVQDERGARELAEERGKEQGKEKGKEEKEIEAVIGFYEIGVTIQNSVKALKITEEKVHEIIAKYKK